MKDSSARDKSFLQFGCMYEFFLHNLFLGVITKKTHLLKLMKAWLFLSGSEMPGKSGSRYE